MNSNDWFFDAFHDDADDSLGLDRKPERIALIMFMVAGMVCTLVLGFNYGGII